jgi:hypothetical protein
MHIWENAGLVVSASVRDSTRSLEDPWRHWKYLQTHLKTSTTNSKFNDNEDRNYQLTSSRVKVSENQRDVRRKCERWTNHRDSGWESEGRFRESKGREGERWEVRGERWEVNESEGHGMRIRGAWGGVQRRDSEWESDGVSGAGGLGMRIKWGERRQGTRDFRGTTGQEGVSGVGRLGIPEGR